MISCMYKEKLEVTQDDFSGMRYLVWLDSYPLFARDLQLDLLFPQLLPLVVVPAERRPFLLDPFLPCCLTDDTVMKILVNEYRYRNGDV